MPLTPTPTIWMNGELVDWERAQIHVLTHTLHYGTGVFEGIRAYETSRGPAVFRLTEHIERLHNSAKILGMEIPYLAAVRPIPRAIWKGKPEGLSVSVEEDVFQLKGLTISSTFIGEGYMSGGLAGVTLYGLALGVLAGMWSRMASPRNGELGILIYASGFFAVVITMRSIMTLTTALLTPAGGIVAGTL